MQASQFNEVFEGQVEACRKLLGVKASEYATGDLLHNFKVAAELQGVTPRQALAGMMAKHTVSIYDMSTVDKPYPKAVWDEKINDHINYLILLQAIVTEEREETLNKVMPGQIPI